MSETLPTLATRTPADLIAWGKSAIETAASFITVKEIHDPAEALRAYQRSVGAAQEAVDAAQEIRIRAERRMGQELTRLEKNAGARGVGTSAVPKGDRTPPKLDDIGVTKRQSSEWQQLAAADDEAFSVALATAKEKGRLSLSAVKGLLRARQLETEAARRAEEERTTGKGKRPKAKPARTYRSTCRPPTPEEEAQDRVTQLFHLTGRLFEMIPHLGDPAEVLELAAKPHRGHPGHRNFDPAGLYGIADFCTALAAAAEERP